MHPRSTAACSPTMVLSAQWGGAESPTTMRRSLGINRDRGVGSTGGGQVERTLTAPATLCERGSGVVASPPLLPNEVGEKRSKTTQVVGLDIHRSFVEAVMIDERGAYSNGRQSCAAASSARPGSRRRPAASIAILDQALDPSLARYSERRFLALDYISFEEPWSHTASLMCPSSAS
jgi:hypothetical protein